MSSIELAYEGVVAVATVGEIADPVRRPAYRPAVRARTRPPVRLTRRGRVVLLTVLLILACALALLIASAGDAAGPAAPAPTVVVHRGDTLWSIATRYVPDGDPVATIEEIRRLNGLDGYTVDVGETLVLPRTRR